MASPHSGSRKDIELVKIETESLSLLIKGRPYHERYESLQEYRGLDFHDTMNFSVSGKDLLKVEIFDVDQGKLSDRQNFRPIFFENNIYQLIVIPKNDEELTFYHEYPALRREVSQARIGDQKVLMGNLQFLNEVGLTEFIIYADNKEVLQVKLEIFPVKLDYKTDYRQMLEEVNNEIYNLAYHFIRRTFLKARTKLEGKPSRTEFFRLITAHFEHFIHALNRIEKQPHHQLRTKYQRARADQLGKQDSYARRYLQKRAHLFMEVEKGVMIENQAYLPVHGLRIRKKLSNDTIENQYVKWMMKRLIHKLEDLERQFKEINELYIAKGQEDNSDVISTIYRMRKRLEVRLRKSFWRRISKLDRSVMSLVMQMAPGYRDAFQIYLTVSKGLALQGSIYRMSVKDIAMLYEYWTFIKLGEILSRKYILVSQDIVSFNQNGLFVNLHRNQKAKRIFKHPVTQERIILTYQHHEGRMPTTNQIPDSTLRIEKQGKDFTFNYIFDAKYRIDYAREGSSYKNRYGSPGPMEEDINTMHRYRDAIVSTNEGPYERTAFGAYVLFPWFCEEEYEHHHFYKSIEKVNIGGLPFLPSATNLVERFVEHLIDKSPEEIYKKGVLPKGTKEEWESSLDAKVLVGLVSNESDYRNYIRKSHYFIPIENLGNNWQDVKFVALYVKKDLGLENGVTVYGEITDLVVDPSGVKFVVDHWLNITEVIKPVNYGISNYMITTFNTLMEAKELPELFMKSAVEMSLWRILRRVSDRIKIDLDKLDPGEATKVRKYSIKDIVIEVNKSLNQIIIAKGPVIKEFSLIDLKHSPTKVFKYVTTLLLEID